MKIAIPTENKKGLNDKVTEHFGRCNTFTFLNEKGELIEIIDNKSQLGLLPPQLLKKHGANVLLCKALGLKAFDLCKQLGIEVYISKAKTVKEIFKEWKNKKIKKANFENICKHGK